MNEFKILKNKIEENNASENQKEIINKFVKMLHKKEETIFVCSRVDEWKQKEIEYKRNETDITEYFEKNQTNQYVSINSFSDNKRKNEKCTSLNAFYIDVDIAHDLEKIQNKNAEEVYKLYKNAYFRFCDYLEESVEKKKILMPSTVFFTGRGFSLTYIFKNPITKKEEFETTQIMYKKLLQKFQELVNQIKKDLYDEIIDVEYEIDSAVTDFTRCIRLPETYNLKAQRYSKVLFLNENCEYEVEDIYKFYDLENVTLLEKPKTKKSKTLKKKENVEIKDIFDCDLENPDWHLTKMPFRERCMLISRIKIISNMILNEYKNYIESSGRRLIIFALYNCLIQLNTRTDAIKTIQIYNSKFAEPLSKTELNAIIRACDERDCYHLKTDVLCKDFLKISREEADALGFYRNVNKKENAEKNKEESLNREINICYLALNTNWTYKKINESINNDTESLSAIKRTLRKYGITHSNRKTKKFEDIDFIKPWSRKEYHSFEDIANEYIR